MRRDTNGLARWSATLVAAGGDAAATVALATLASRAEEATCPSTLRRGAPGSIGRWRILGRIGPTARP